MKRTESLLYVVFLAMILSIIFLLHRGCVHIPGKKTNPYDLKVCPWDAIEMIPTEEVAVAVSQMGGPPDYVEENWDRLVDTAQHLAELKAAK